MDQEGLKGVQELVKLRLYKCNCMCVIVCIYPYIDLKCQFQNNLPVHLLIMGGARMVINTICLTAFHYSQSISDAHFFEIDFQSPRLMYTFMDTFDFH